MGPRDLEELSLPAPQRHLPSLLPPAFHVALTRKACNRLALRPALMGLWAREGTRGTHLLSVTARRSPPRDGRGPVWEFCMAVHCMCCRPTWLPPAPGCSANITSSIPQLPPHRDPRTTCQLTGHKKLQSVVLNKQKPNAQALRPEKDFSKPPPHTFTLPADSLVDDSVHTKPSTVLPHETVTSQTSLSLGLDSDQEVGGGSRSPTVPALRGSGSPP